MDLNTICHIIDCLLPDYIGTTALSCSQYEIIWKLGVDVATLGLNIWMSLIKREHFQTGMEETVRDLSDMPSSEGIYIKESK